MSFGMPCTLASNQFRQHAQRRDVSGSGCWQRLLHACRSAEEADAQSLRTAVLLDELDAPQEGERDHRAGSIIVELKVCLHRSCSVTCQMSAPSLVSTQACCRSLPPAWSTCPLSLGQRSGLHPENDCIA